MHQLPALLDSQAKTALVVDGESRALHQARLACDAGARVSVAVPTLATGPGSADLVTLHALGEPVSGGAVAALADRRAWLHRAVAQ